MGEAHGNTTHFHSSSALQNVFGSEVSLAELNGDISSRMNSRAGSPKLESLTAHRRTHRAKTRSMSTSRPGAYHYFHSTNSLSLLQLLTRAGVLFALGAAYGWYHTTQIPATVPLAVPLQVNGQLLGVAGLSAIILGLVMPLVDWGMPASFGPHAKGKAGKDWLSIVRALGAFLGMMYAVSKLQIATIFWCLASPFLWYVLDSSLNGLLAASGTALGGPLVMYLIFPDSFNSMPREDNLHVFGWLAASYFSASIFFGNLGRRLFPLPVAGP